MTFPDMTILDNLIDKKPRSRKRPLYDREVHKFHNDLHNNTTTGATEDPDKITVLFKEKMHEWICDHKLISFTGLDAFPDRNICLGVTHQLDELHMMHNSGLHSLYF